MDCLRLNVAALRVLILWTLGDLCHIIQSISWLAWDIFPHQRYPDCLGNLPHVLRTAEASGWNIMHRFWVWFWPLLSCNLPWFIGSHSYVPDYYTGSRKKPLPLVAKAIPLSFHLLQEVASLATCEPTEMTLIWSFQDLLNKKTRCFSYIFH